mmetsp:Transcript_24848/g.51326  ORF Transcript_24848/g.51326 Transcript_24848/m.51326 type:complete len:642 (-) Transcript_24848:1210-3135(-)
MRGAGPPPPPPPPCVGRTADSPPYHITPYRTAGTQAHMHVCLHALDAVLHLLVELLEALDVLLRGVPVAAAVGLKEGGDHVTERVRVRVEEALLHLRVGDEDVVGILVDEVVNVARGGAPAHGVAEALGDLAGALVARREHALVELRVEKLGARVEADRLAERAHLGVGRGGVGHHGHRLLLVVAQARHDLGRVRVVVVAHVGERDLGRVEVLEGAVDGLERRLELVLRRVHLARAVRVEREALAVDELLLELLLALPAAVLDREADVGRVRAGRVREDAGGGLADRHALLLSLLERVLADKVLRWVLVELGGHLDRAVHEGHLVDEEVAEDARARDDNVDARPAELLERDHLELVHAADRVSDRADAEEHEDLGERLAVGLDVVGAPEGEGDRLRVGLAVLRVGREALEEAVDDDEGAVHGGRGRDGLRVEGVHVLAGREHVRVADRVAARTRDDVAAVEGRHKGAELVVSDDLLEAKLKVLEVGRERLLRHLEALSLEGLGPGRAAREDRADRLEERVDLLDAALRVGRRVDERADGVAAGGVDGVELVDVREDTVVVVAVDLVDVTVDRLGDKAREALESVLRAVELSDVDEGGDGLLGGRRHADGVEAAREQARLDLHEALVDLAHDGVTLVDGHGL